MDNEYRITTNGFRYRIERKRIAFWSNRLVWTPMGTWGGFPAPFYGALEDARNALQRVINGEAEKRNSWKPIE